MLSKEIGLVALVAMALAGAVKVYDSGLTEKLRAGRDADLVVEIVAPSTPANGYSDIVRIAKNRDGHFYTDLMINRRNVNVLIDTGASILALRDSDAEAVGLYPKPADFKFPVNTANGQTMAARMMVQEIELGRLTVRDADVFILPDEQLAKNLLGMNVLSEMGRVEFNQAELIIEKPLGRTVPERTSATGQ